MTDRLQRSFESLKRDTAEQVSGIDLRDGVMAAIAEPDAESEAESESESESESEGRRRWPWVFAPAMVACAIALVAIVWPRSRTTIAVSSDEPMIAGDRVVSGERIGLPTPVRLTASATTGATIDAGDGRHLRLWPGSQLVVRDPSHVVGLVGGVSITADKPLRLALDVDLVGRGTFELETHRPGAPMTLTRNHKIAGAVALAAVVTAGWITIQTREGTERIVAPGAAVVGEDGALTRLAPADWKRRAIAAGSSADGTGEHGPVSPVSGAYWDEDEQRISFALAGEVFDGESGAPINAFDVEAVPVESKGFGKVGVVKRSISGSERGAFELNNVGLGTWRVTVRATDYAPSSQIVDLGDLHANPLLQFPLTEGARITGQVVDWRNRAVEGAEVGQPGCFENRRPTCRLVKTDGDGRFELPALPEEQVFALRAEHPRYGFAEQKNLVQKVGETRHVVIALSGVVEIAGEVTRGDAAAPVEGAVVASDDGVTATTDAAGHYEMLVPLGERPQVFVVKDPKRPGPVKIASYPDNRSSREVKWVEADTHVGEVEIDFRLQMESAQIHGTLTDEAGKPIAGARLDFANTAGWKHGRGHETYPTTATTDGQGRYRLRDVPAEAGYRVHFMAEGRSLTLLGFVTVPSEVDVEANFVLGTGAIRGEFTTADGKPFAAGPVGCRRLGARSRDNVYHVARCIGDDRFELTGLPPGTYTLENRQPKQSTPITFTKTTVEVGPGEVVDNVKMVVSGSESKTWRVRVLDADNRFVPGAYSRVRHEHTTWTSNLQVGDDGVAEINLSENIDLLWIDAPGYKSARIELEGRDPKKVITVQLERDK